MVRSPLCRSLDRSILVLAALLVAALSGRGLLAAPRPALDCPSCDDFNPCTVDSCDTSTGTCRHDPASCDDGNPCTSDACLFNASNPAASLGCVHTVEPAGTACSDGLACTTNDACDGAGHCSGQALPAGTACDDGNDCTSRDVCDAAGRCQGQRESNAGTSCDDGNPCTSGDTCVATPAGSVICQGTAIACDDGDPCTTDACDPATGACIAPPVDCDDGNECTLDSCDPATGACEHVPAEGACNDNNFCTVNDICVGGNCFASPRDCSDGIACTNDFCVNEVNACRHDPDSALCPNSSECFAGVCDPQQGCVLNPRIGSPCNGGNKCFAGVCNNFGCQIQVFLCNDNNSCTIDACLDPDSGACGHTNSTGSCDDGNACTVGDTCSGGACQSGTTPLDCDDHNACTIDFCDPASGCKHVFDSSLPDSDGDGVPDVCDNCPTVANPGQADCDQDGIGDACQESLFGPPSISFQSSLGKGSGTVQWTTRCELDLKGFNVVMIDGKGVRTQLNLAEIPCESCIAGGRIIYTSLVPKHKSGHGIFVETVHIDGRVELSSEAVRQ